MAAAKGNKYALGNKGGRPTKYDPKYCEELIKYFSTNPTDDQGNANRLPALHRFAQSINAATRTVLDWRDKHEEFLQAYTRAHELQKWFLIENGLNGNYNPGFAKFVAVNITNMRDKQEVETNPNVNINIDADKIQDKTVGEIAMCYRDLLKSTGES